MTPHPNRSKRKSKTATPEITGEIARKVLDAVDAGLVKGVGKPIPGQMCVEAAVCYALGLPHGDEPTCVAPALRNFKIRLNDSNWSSDMARAKGLRRLALVQLGSAGHLDEKEFIRRIVDLAIRKASPRALRAAASICKDEKHKAALCEAANRCEKEGTRAAAENARDVAREWRAYAAYAYAYAYAAAADAAAYADAYAYAYAAAARSKLFDDTRDKALSEHAEDVVQILIEMKVPGCEWLPLTEAA